METVDFSYRLPVTFLRATGTVTTSTDVDGTRTTDHKVAVTTELAADLRSRCGVSLDARDLATQKTVWSLTSDGRLIGADLALTAEPLARWGAGLHLGATVAGFAAPTLLAAGPAGWLGLAALAGAATLGGAALAGASGLRALRTDVGMADHVDLGKPVPPQDASPDEWDVHAGYVQDHGDEAQELANLRSALAVAGRARARAVRAAAMTDDAAEQEYWEARVTQLRRLLTSAAAGAARAEALYATWLASKVTIDVASFDVRLPIDVIPTQADVEAWAKGQDMPLYSEWVDMVADLHTAVSIDIDPAADTDVLPNLEFSPQTSNTKVHYRPPRPAVLRVWKAVPVAQGDGHRYTLEPSEIRRMPVSCPGNETLISIETAHDVTNAVAVTFDDSGALTKVATDIKDRTVQRSADLSAIYTKVGEAVTAGKGLREAVSPPSLADRAAEAKAAAELGLVPGKDDPLKDLRAQLEEAQLRAQLKLAEQIQASTSMPVFVSMSTSTSS